MSVKKTVAARKSSKSVAKAAKVTKKVAAKKAANANARRMITDEFTIKVLKKENPFTGEVQKSNAAKVLSSKTVAEAKKKGADSWTIRELTNRKIISVAKAS